MNVISGPGVRGAEAAGRRRQETGWIATLPHVRGEAKTGRGEGGQSESFLNRCCDVLGEPGAENGNAMPLGFRGPFVVGVLPRPLRGHGKNGELRTVVVPRLTLLRVGSNKSDEGY